MTANTLPKSLHTVTVLVQVARHLMQRDGKAQPHEAVQAALRMIYGQDIPSDGYGLAATAARKLAAEMRRGGAL